MNKRHLKLFGIGLAAALTVSGCGASGQSAGTKGTSGEDTQAGNAQTENAQAENTQAENESAGADDTGALTFWSLFTGGDGEFMDDIIAEYNKTSPAQGVKSITMVWDDYYTKLQTSVAADKGPDIGVSHVSRIPELAELGVIDPIDDYISQLGIKPEDIYIPAELESVTYGGQIYALPLDMHGEILCFNSDIISKAGIQLNEAGKLDINSKDQMKEVLDKIRAALPEGGSTLAFPNQGTQPYRVWYSFYNQLDGAPILSEDGTELTWDKDKALEALTYLNSLYRDGYIAPGIDDFQGLFESGKAGLLINGTVAVANLERLDNFNWEVQTFPAVFGKPAGYVNSHSLILPRNKERSEEESLEAVKFMQYATADGAYIWSGSGNIPANQAILNSEEYEKIPHRSDYKAMAEEGVYLFQSLNYSSIENGLIEVFNKVWLGDLTPEAAVDEAETVLKDNLS